MNSLQIGSLFSLAGKTAIVTGGGRGIGYGIAKGLGTAGADVVVASRNLSNCEKVAREIEAIGRNALALKTDISSFNDVKQMVKETIRQWGKIDILVNNAGILDTAPITQFSEEHWDYLLDINLQG